MDTESAGFFDDRGRGPCLQHGEASYGEVDCGEGYVFVIFGIEKYTIGGAASLAADRISYRC